VTATVQPARIAFCLPSYSSHAIGGYRIVYEYANRLAALGHEVAVLHVVPSMRFEGADRWLRRGAWGRRREAWRHRNDIGWMAIDPRVRMLRVGALTPRRLAPFDALVATAWQTAPPVATAVAEQGASGYYLVQHHETWAGDASDVEASWRLPLHKVVISRWLVDLVVAERSPSAVSYVPNGLDLEAFRIERDVADRDPHHLGMLVHPEWWKGTEYGLAALEMVRERNPLARFTLFGNGQRPSSLPADYGYERALSGDRLRAYYNSLAVFLHPSLAEGWPLPPAEAMACGAALVAADNPGVLDYAVAGETAEVVPRENPEALARAILELMVDQDRRMALARAGNAAMQAYTWDRAVSGFREALHAG
jgi:glycosyltransferase involved in cell wall biosynthesis